MLHALLVGIDDYPPPLRPLRGSVNDVDAVEAYLRSRFAGDDAARVLVLRDAEATRAAVIDAFRSHLGRAGPGDTALFHFSGHGSQQPSRPESWAVEPDRLDETLVCWDSRASGRWDLADKELSALIAEVAARGAHVVVVLDCCHSGSGTRLGDDGVRGVAADTRARPADTLLTRLPNARGEAGWEVPGTARHVLFAACRPWERAEEFPGRGGMQGALTHALLLTLRRARRPLTCHELFKRASATMRRYAAQTPQLEAPDLRDLERVFLDGAQPPRAAHLTVTDEGGHWFVDAGAVHGMPRGEADDRPVLALFPVGTESHALRDPRNVLGRAVVTRVDPGRSRVRVTLEPSASPERSYAATVLRLPRPPLPVRLEGDPAGAEALRRALAGPPSAFVREASAESLYRVTARREAGNARFELAREADGFVVATHAWRDEDDARSMAARLEHVARWETTLRLRNPLGKVPADAVGMTFMTGRRTGAGPDLRLVYTRQGGAWTPPRFRLRVENRWSEPLFCALFALSEAFEIFPDLLPGIWLNVGESVVANEGRPIVARVPDAMAREGVTRRIDRLKLVASTEEFDASLLKQPALTAAGPYARAGASAPGSVLARHLHGPRRRAPVDGDESVHDWMSADATIITVRPPAAAPA